MGLYNSFGGGRFSFWQSWLTWASRFANSQASALNVGVPTVPYLPESNCSYLACILISQGVVLLVSLLQSHQKDWFWHDWSSNFNVISMSKTSKIHTSTTILLCLLSPLVWHFLQQRQLPHQHHYSTASTVYCVHPFKSSLCISYTTWYLWQWFTKIKLHSAYGTFQYYRPHMAKSNMVNPVT